MRNRGRKAWKALLLQRMEGIPPLGTKAAVSPTARSVVLAEIIWG